jgi:ribonuclease HII
VPRTKSRRSKSSLKTSSQSRLSSQPNEKSQSKSLLPKKISAQSPLQKSRLQSSRTAERLLRFDRRLGARFVAGADEAGRGSLAGPLVVAGVLLDYESLRDHRVRPLAHLNDSKQVSPEDREALFRAVLAAATQISVQMISHAEIDREGLHRSNLAGLRRALHALTPPAEARLVDGFRLGPSAPEHVAVVDGDERSAAIAAASIVAKVVRDRTMRRMDALYPGYGFSSHVGYITPRHSRIVRERGPCEIHRRSFQALCYLSEEEAAARLAAV